MASYSSKTVFQPSIPAHLMNDEDRRVFEAFGITMQPDGEDKFFLFSEGWQSSAHVDGVELEERELFARVQDIIRRSNGEFPWVSTETAHMCNRMRPDGFAGSAVFITADDVQYTCTSSWLEQRISEAETGDTGPDTDDADVPTSVLSVDLVYQGKTGGYKAVAEITGDKGTYDELRVGFFKGDECIGDALFTLTKTGEPRAILTIGGDGNGDPKKVWYPLRDADGAIENCD